MTEMNEDFDGDQRYEIYEGSDEDIIYIQDLDSQSSRLQQRIMDGAQCVLKHVAFAEDLEEMGMNATVGDDIYLMDSPTDFTQPAFVLSWSSTGVSCIRGKELYYNNSMKAAYRKLNDGSLNSSTYHKKDGTNVRAKLKAQTRKEEQKERWYNNSMETPQIIIIVLVALNLMVNLIKNGESKKHSFVAALIDNSVIIGLLIWGGFFS
jgi:hypothetical protein